MCEKCSLMLLDFMTQFSFLINLSWGTLLKSNQISFDAPLGFEAFRDNFQTSFLTVPDVISEIMGSVWVLIYARSNLFANCRRNRIRDVRHNLIWNSRLRINQTILQMMRDVAQVSFSILTRNDKMCDKARESYYKLSVKSPWSERHKKELVMGFACYYFTWKEGYVIWAIIHAQSVRKMISWNWLRPG
jgi:hypothetical protein